ncbi:unnamed protein product [Polarella glacialis]|uniref:Uncharacterized protein n=1 Tax=Polarella glacialis TaxID=89957 RepID=A0A813G6K0_POLGL|nr:unnamed protein product [Polarella glacialis]CAE8675867.1 unnamed protein product [Polarella glacialis]
MGAGRSRADPGSDSRSEELTAGARDEEPNPGEEATFSVEVRTMAGDSVMVHGLKPSQPIQTFCVEAANSIGWPAFQTNLCIGAAVCNLGSEQTLQQVGLIAGGTDIQVLLVRRPALEIANPGMSRFNRNYVCTVTNVREVEFRTLQVDFCVVGDNSAGELQQPTKSKLHAGSRRLTVSSHSYQHEDWKHKIEGSLIFKDVPLTGPGPLAFEFGQSGYTRLPLTCY